MSSSSSSSASSKDVIPDGSRMDDYCKLKYYLHCVLEECGVDCLEARMMDYESPPPNDDDQKHALLTVATGKQFGLASLSYKTIFLDSTIGNTLLPDSAGPALRFLTMEEANQVPLEIDPLLLGGMIPVEVSKVMICNAQWVRTFYMEPMKRLQQQQQQATGGGHTLSSSSNTPLTISHAEIQSLFVHESKEEREAGMMDMASKLQKMLQGGSGGEGGRLGGLTSQPQEPKFQSFSGQGQSLGSTTATSADTTDSGLWNTDSLPDTLPVLDTTAPLTSIAVRLLNGKRMVIQLNGSHTVLDLATHLKKEMETTTTFRLVTGFPPKPLTNPKGTIEEENLKGAQVSIQKV